MTGQLTFNVAMRGGFLYFTIKSGSNHAAACYISTKVCYLIDSEIGLCQYDSPHEFETELSNFNRCAFRCDKAVEFKIYDVSLL